MTERTTEIAPYVEDCRSLRRDLNALLDDLKFEAQGGHVFYAVDFSEVHAFVFPNEVEPEMGLFADDETDTIRIIQRAALNKLFFDFPDKLILLQPYLVELTTTVDSIRGAHASDIAEHVGRLLEENRRVTELPGFKELVDLIGRRTQVGFDALRDAVTFLERHAGRLLSLLEDKDYAPRRRLRRLLRSEPFTGLEDRFGAGIEPDPESLTRWYDTLRRARTRAPAGSSYLDALAVAIVMAVNRTFGTDRRLRLITRSSIMHHVAAGEEDLWRSSGGSPIRHPRCFSVVSPQADAAGGPVGHLMSLERSLALFLASYDDFARDMTGQQVDAGSFLTSIRAIKSEWRARAVLLASLRSVEEPAGEREVSSQALRVLRALSEEDGLRHLIEGRIRELTELIERDYQILGMEAHAQSSARRAFAEQHLRYVGKRDKSVLASTSYRMPYTVQFYAPDLRAWVSLLEGSTSVPWADILGSFREGTSQVGLERLLAIAYLFGAWNRWQLAEQYCDLALAAQDRTSLPAHEALYFKAICLRKFRPTTARFAEAIKYLGDAAMDKARAEDNPTYEDPRFLKEEAAVILIWNAWFATVEPVGPLPPLPSRALDLSYRALARIVNDLNLKAQIHNNLCFYYTNQDDAASDVRAHLNELLLALGESGQPRQHWAPNYLDTIGWATWRLRSRPTAADVYAQVLECFDQALEMAAPDDVDRGGIVRHKHMVEEEYRSEIQRSDD